MFPSINVDPHIEYGGKTIRKNLDLRCFSLEEKKLQEREGTSLNYFEVFLTLLNNFLCPSQSILLYLN